MGGKPREERGMFWVWKWQGLDVLKSWLKVVAGQQCNCRDIRWCLFSNHKSDARSWGSISLFCVCMEGNFVILSCVPSLEKSTMACAIFCVGKKVCFSSWFTFHLLSQKTQNSSNGLDLRVYFSSKENKFYDHLLFVLIWYLRVFVSTNWS